MSGLDIFFLEIRQTTCKFMNLSNSLWLPLTPNAVTFVYFIAINGRLI